MSEAIIDGMGENRRQASVLHERIFGRQRLRTDSEKNKSGTIDSNRKIHKDAACCSGKNATMKNITESRAHVGLRSSGGETKMRRRLR
jgi:hypothetical protein